MTLIAKSTVWGWRWDRDNKIGRLRETPARGKAQAAIDWDCQRPTSPPPPQDYFKNIKSLEKDSMDGEIAALAGGIVFLLMSLEVTQ